MPNQRIGSRGREHASRMPLHVEWIWRQSHKYFVRDTPLKCALKCPQPYNRSIHQTSMKNVGSWCRKLQKDKSLAKRPQKTRRRNRSDWRGFGSLASSAMVFSQIAPQLWSSFLNLTFQVETAVNMEYLRKNPISTLILYISTLTIRYTVTIAYCDSFNMQLQYWSTSIVNWSDIVTIRLL